MRTTYPLLLFTIAAAFSPAPPRLRRAAAAPIRGPAATAPLATRSLGCSTLDAAGRHRGERSCRLGAAVAAECLLPRGGGALLASPSEDGGVSATPSEVGGRIGGVTPSSAVMSSTYHLLWSPGVWKKLLFSTTALLALRWALISHEFSLTGPLRSLLHPPGCHHAAAAAAAAAAASSPTVASSLVGTLSKFVILPLLSSACCAVQLLINALFAGAGCVGFNAFLGPLRPYFLSFMAVSAVSSWRSGTRVRSASRVASVAASWAITLLPEAVHLLNERRMRIGNAGHSGDVLRSGLGSTLTGKTAVLLLTMPSMGCVACVDKIDSSVRALRLEQVLESSSWLTDDGTKGGRARVVLVAGVGEDLDLLVLEIVGAIEGAGFPCQVDSLMAL